MGSEQTSVTYLERRAEVLYNDDHWRIRGQLQNFQTIDNYVPNSYVPIGGNPNSAIDLRPASRVPRIAAEGLYPLGNSPLEFALDSEATNFLRDVGPTGVRVNLQPELRWSSRGAGWYFEPAAGYYLTQYDLENASPGDPSNPHGHHALWARRYRVGV